ncbi:MAG: hypothetical protein AABX03_01175 [Nanoarchaeota archaeon]
MVEYPANDRRKDSPYYDLGNYMELKLPETNIERRVLVFLFALENKVVAIYDSTHSDKCFCGRVCLDKSSKEGYILTSTNGNGEISLDVRNLKRVFEFIG